MPEEKDYIDPNKFTTEELVKIMYLDLVKLKRDFAINQVRQRKLFITLIAVAAAAIGVGVGLGLLSVKDLIALKP